MMFSPSFSSKLFAILAALGLLYGCASAVGRPSDTPRQSAIAARAQDGQMRIAVLPLANLGKSSAPLKEIDQALAAALRSRGLDLLEESRLEAFLERHRIRYTGGVTNETGQALATETGAQAILVTSLELFSDPAPPKVALTSRLVSSGRTFEILWMDAVALAGDDAPGLLALHLVTDPEILLQTAIARLADSLAGHLAGTDRRLETQSPKNTGFGPKEYYASPVLISDSPYRVAVVPFFNLSASPNAGDMMALHFVRHLRTFTAFEVIEPGEVRNTLLELRIVMDDGISFANADLIFSRLNADLILTGKVLEYADYQGSNGTVKADFTAMLFDRKSREMVWSARAYNDGDEAVSFFKRGKVTTAHALASRMVAGALSLIDSPPPR